MVSQYTPLKPSGHVHWQLALTYPPFWHTGGDVQCATEETSGLYFIQKHIPPFWHNDTIYSVLQKHYLSLVYIHLDTMFKRFFDDLNKMYLQYKCSLYINNN